MTGTCLGGVIDRTVGTVDIPFLLVSFGLVGSEFLIVAELLVVRIVLVVSLALVLPRPLVVSPMSVRELCKSKGSINEDESLATTMPNRPFRITRRLLITSSSQEVLA